MNVKKTLEEIGYLEFKMFMLMENVKLGGYTVEIGQDYLELSKQKEVLLMQVVESSVTLTQRVKPITQEKKILPERSEIHRLNDVFEEEYNRSQKYPLPKNVKEQLKNLL